MAALVADLRATVAQVAQGGGEAARKRHLARGKLLPRERVAALIDPGIAVPGIVAARRARHVRRRGSGAPASSPASAASAGRECVIVANDATVKGGTYYPDHREEASARAGDRAQNRLPCIYLVDSGGANLPNQDEVFPDRDHFGRIFFNQANHVGAGHPADRRGDGLVHRGRRLCAGDDATRASSCASQGTIFLGGPPLVKAATGEIVSAEDLGGADVHSRTSGVADHYAENDAHALAHVPAHRRWR